MIKQVENKKDSLVEWKLEAIKSRALAPLFPNKRVKRSWLTLTVPPVAEQRLKVASGRGARGIRSPTILTLIKKPICMTFAGKYAVQLEIKLQVIYVCTVVTIMVAKSAALLGVFAPAYHERKNLCGYNAKTADTVTQSRSSNLSSIYAVFLRTF